MPDFASPATPVKVTGKTPLLPGGDPVFRDRGRLVGGDRGGERRRVDRLLQNEGLHLRELARAEALGREPGLADVAVRADVHHGRVEGDRGENREDDGGEHDLAPAGAGPGPVCALGGHAHGRKHLRSGPDPMGIDKNTRAERARRTSGRGGWRAGSRHRPRVLARAAGDPRACVLPEAGAGTGPERAASIATRGLNRQVAIEICYLNALVWDDHATCQSSHRRFGLQAVDDLRLRGIDRSRDR